MLWKISRYIYVYKFSWNSCRLKIRKPIFFSFTLNVNSHSTQESVQYLEQETNKQIEKRIPSRRNVEKWLHLERIHFLVSLLHSTIHTVVWFIYIFIVFISSTDFIIYLRWRRTNCSTFEWNKLTGAHNLFIKRWNNFRCNFCYGWKVKLCR